MKPLKKLVHPVTGKIFKMGRRQPLVVAPRLHLRNYLKRGFPTPPPSITYSGKAWPSLKKIYLNDQLGDCVIAGIGHIQGVLTGNAGALELFTDAQITRMYSDIGGYVPGDPNTDQGCDETVAFNYWQSPGFVSPANRISGHLAVNGADAEEVRIALWLFENISFGMNLPDAWVNPMPSGSGFVWRKTGSGDADPNNGHFVIGFGYDSTGNVNIASWGMTGLITSAAIAKYATTGSQGDTHTVLSKQAINKATQRAPNGFDFPSLQADFAALT